MPPRARSRRKDKESIEELERRLKRRPESGRGGTLNRWWAVLAAAAVVASAAGVVVYYEMGRGDEGGGVYHPPPNGNGTGNETPHATGRHARLMVLNDTAGAGGSPAFAKRASHTLESGGMRTQFLLLVQNTGTEALDVAAGQFLDNAGPWRMDLASTHIQVGPGKSMPIIATLNLTSFDKTRTHKVIITYTDSNGTDVQDAVDLVCTPVKDAGVKPAWGMNVTVEWTILHRGVDSAYQADNWSQTASGTSKFRLGDYTGMYGERIIIGLHEAVARTRTLEDAVYLIRADKAYGSASDDGLPNGDVIFHFRIVSAEPG